MKKAAIARANCPAKARLDTIFRVEAFGHQFFFRQNLVQTLCDLHDYLQFPMCLKVERNKRM